MLLDSVVPASNACGTQSPLSQFTGRCSTHLWFLLFFSPLAYAQPILLVCESHISLKLCKSHPLQRSIRPWSIRTESPHLHCPFLHASDIRADGCMHNCTLALLGFGYPHTLYEFLPQLNSSLSFECQTMWDLIPAAQYRTLEIQSPSLPCR